MYERQGTMWNQALTVCRLQITNQNGLQATSEFEMCFALSTFWCRSQPSQPKHVSNPDSVNKFKPHLIILWSFFQAQTTLKNNIFFNCDRASLNINDGFGGGNEVTGNLLFNTGRADNKDEGAVNTWDRVRSLPQYTSAYGQAPTVFVSLSKSLSFLFKREGRNKGGAQQGKGGAQTRQGRGATSRLGRKGVTV